MTTSTGHCRLRRLVDAAGQSVVETRGGATGRLGRVAAAPVDP